MSFSIDLDALRRQVRQQRATRGDRRVGNSVREPLISREAHSNITPMELAKTDPVPSDSRRNASIPQEMAVKHPTGYSTIAKFSYDDFMRSKSCARIEDFTCDPASGGTRQAQTAAVRRVDPKASVVAVSNTLAIDELRRCVIWLSRIEQSQSPLLL